MNSADFRIYRPIQITDAMLTSSTVAEDDFPAWVSGAAYVVGDKRIRTTTHLVYMAKTAHSGVATLPENDTTNWEDVDATNRWKMFDKMVASQTVAPDSISVTVAPGQLANTLTLMNLSGSQVTVSQSESGYSRTKSLVQHNVLSWYDFYYEDPIREGDAVFDDIPPYATSSLTVTVDNPGATAGIGGFFLGKPRTIGKTQWEFSGGILSYSTSKADTFGRETMVKRDNAKKLSFEVYISPGFESEAYRLLRHYTDVEIVIIGAGEYSMTFSYGFLEDWRVPVSIKGKTAPIAFRGLI